MISGAGERQDRSTLKRRSVFIQHSVSSNIPPRRSVAQPDLCGETKSHSIPCRSPKDTESLLVLEGAVEPDEEGAVSAAVSTQVVQDVALAAHVLRLPLPNDVPLLTDFN